MSEYRIGDIARHAGVTVETIRFYEAQALIPKPPRTNSGYRLYTAETIRRIRFIKRAKELGFSLKDINALLVLRSRPGVTCSEVKIQALQKIAEVEDKIEDLMSILSALTGLVEQCDADADLSECPILDALDEKEAGAGDDR